jgi:hypothetical protein
MAQYAVLIFERQMPGGVADIPPDVMEAHGRLPERVAEQGGRIVAGLALNHALELAKLTPIFDGGVEVRPLIGFDVLETT